MNFKSTTQKSVLFFALSFFWISAFSQNISLKGKVLDVSDKSAIQGSTIKIASQKNVAVLQQTISDNNGNFIFNNLTADTYIVTISNSGYTSIQQKVALQASNKSTIQFSISKKSTDLKGVTIISKPPPIRQNGDTTEFNASQFKVNPDATAEDLIKKLPGVTVAKDGTVTTMGEQIQKVTVDGKDFFGNDATAALRNLPAEIIDKIQVFDKLSDQAQLTGFDDGNSVKALNIVTKAGIKNGQFGRILAGIGTEGTYNGGGNVSFFKGDRRLSLVGNFNNINQQNFSTQDILGATSGGGGGGRGGGGGSFGGGGGGGGSANFNVGQVSGINKTNAAGLNFSNVYNKKLTITSSYFFNNSNNINESLTNAETFSDPKNRFSTSNNNSISDNNNHRANMRIEYKIDTANSVFIIPSISFQKNKTLTSATSQMYYGVNDSLNSSVSNGQSSKSGYNINNNIMFRHAFKKRGRTISFGINTTWNKNDGNSFTNGNYVTYNLGLPNDSLTNRLSDNNTNGTTTGATVAYTEPIGKKGQIQIDYNPTIQKNNANQQTYDWDGLKYSKFDTGLSNNFSNTITTNNGGISYRLGRSRDEQLMFGVNYQHSQLESQRIFPTATSVNQSFSNVLPNIMYRKKIGKYNNIRLFYRASVNFPSISQLQDVLNKNNPLNVSAGNPDLKQSYSNFLTTRYTYTNTKTSKSFFANILLQTASNYITTATYFPTKDSLIENTIISKSAQFSKPVNLNGYQSLRTFFTYSMPLKFIKTTLNVNSGFSYSKLPGLVNTTNTITNSYAYNGGAVLASNISEYIDFNLSYNAIFNYSNTNTKTITTSNYVNQTTSGSVNLLSKKGWFVQTDVTGNMYNYIGSSTGTNQTFWVWNASTGKKILKKQAGEIKFSVFDILKQNKSVVTTITGTGISTAQTQVLQQYFMLTFTYKLKNFGTPSKQGNREFGGQRGGGPGGFGGGFGGGRGGAPNF